MSPDEPLDLDQDLFDFDELLRDAELFGAPNTARAVAPQPAPPAALPAAALPVAAASTTTPAQATHRPPRRPPPVAPRPAPVAVAEVEPASMPVAPVTAQHQPTQIRVSRGLALTLCGVAALNLMLLALVFQALGTVRGMARDAGARNPENRAAEHELAPEPAATSGAAVAPPEEGLAALERAAELSANGEHQRARESLYALLAVADRLPAESRLGVGARARLLIADAWRLEADAHAAALAHEQETPR
jgi:hypothetical protein